MGRRHKKRGGATDLGGRMLAAGGLLTLLPIAGSGVPGFAGLGHLVPIGLALMSGGGGLLYLSRRQAGAAESPRAEPGASERRAQRPQKGTSTNRPVEQPRPLGPTIVPDVVKWADIPETGRIAAPKAPTVWGPDVFRVIEWRRFEAVVEALFAQSGMETKSQSHGADGGVDIWLYSRSQPGQPVSIVQCKQWNGKRVGVDKVRELRGVMAAHGVRRGQFATTSTFTPDAIAFAKENGINLLDVDGLLSLIATRTAAQQQELLSVATEGEYWRPTCVNCGIKLIDRIRTDKSRFWGCTNYPHCRTTINPPRSIAMRNATAHKQN